MRLFSYYALHSFVNQLRKLFKTWVLIFLLVCMLIGGVIGLGVGRLSDLAEEQEGTQTEEIGGEDIPDLPDLPESPGLLEEAGLDRYGLLELIAGGVLLAVLAFEAISADKNGSKLFLPADVNLLFASPMKPQSVLLFRLATQLGTAIFMSIYLLLQLPNLTLNMGLSVAASLAVIVTWGLTIMLGKLLQVLLYLLCAEHPWLKENLRRIVYLCLGLLLAGFLLFWKLSGLSPLGAAARFFNAPATRAVPVWGWLKGFCMFAAEGNATWSLVCLALVLLGGAALWWAITRAKADFYEDAMAKSEEMAELLAAAQSEKSNGLLIRRKKDRSDKLRRDTMRRGHGANVFFFKPLYNRFRFAHLGVFTKTTETYLAAAVATAVLCRFVFDTDSIIVPALALAGLAFFRALGNPLAQDTKMDFFRLIPESTWAKLFYSLLGGTVNCLLDALPGLLVAALILRAPLLPALAWLPLIASVDFYATAVGAFIDLSVPVSAGKTIKQVVQIMFIYFGLLPDIAVIAVGFVMDSLPFAVLVAALLNLALGLLFSVLAGAFLEPKAGRAVSEGLRTVDLRQARRHFSRLGFGAFAILAVTSVLQFVLGRVLSDYAAQPWFLWLVSFVPLYCVGVPVGLLVMRGVPKAAHERRSLRPKEMFSALAVSIFMMYAGNLVGTLIVTLVQSQTALPSSNPLENYVGNGSLALQALFMVVLAPIVEEFIFRRTLIDRMRPYGEALAVVTSALMFGLFHGNLSQLFYAFTLGLVFGCVYLVTGKLRYTIALHMIINFIGGVLGPTLLERAGEGLDLEALEAMDFSALSSAATPGMAAFLAYTLALLALGVVGLVLLCVYARRLRFDPAPLELPKGRRFATVYGNAGMILMLLFCLGLIVLSLFS